MGDQQPSFPSSEERSWWLLSHLPYCPSKDDIALETHYITVTALPFSDENDEIEEFVLDDSYFGKIQTIIRNRDPKAIFNIRLSSNLPFLSENDFLELVHSEERDPSERKSESSPANTGYTDPDHFVQADFDNVLQQCACLQDNIDKGIDGAEAQLEQYRTFRRSHVEIQLKHVRECNHWLIEADRYYRTKALERFNHQFTLIQKRLRRDGFKDVDVDDAEHELRSHLSRECDHVYSHPHKTVVRYTNLTRSNWNKIRHEYGDIVQVYTQRRIQREREELVDKIIQEFQNTTTPMSWRHWPPRYILHGMSPFSNILNLDAKYASDSCLEAACKRGKTLLQSFIDDWLSGVKYSLRMDSYFEMEFGFELDDKTDSLDLATTVFFCLHCRHRQAGHCLVGWEDAVTHLHHPAHHHHDHRSISFSSSGYDTICALLRLLDLDPASMLAVAMDQRDDRFIRLNNLTSELQTKHRQLHSEQSWKVVPSSLAVIIKKREASLDPRYSEDSWSCNHCPKHLHGLVSRRSVQTHVYEEHGICQAQENTDFLYMVRYDGKISPNLFKLPGSVLHQCLHCPLSLKLWNDTSLKQHQFGKHGIKSPTAGIDYCCVWEGFEQETLPPDNE
ncbi:hypothetical protein L218DRAFT_997069 [Marasmius fiardii PR-910]|nr:hypothetical protein L218DRAFT_997069 [Marasmius fiardii PR-910]